MAGLGWPRTTSQQRAVNFLMTMFQKIMSSPRAIRQSLRRHLLTVLAREHMRIESRAGARTASPAIATRRRRLQDEMRKLAIAILGLPDRMSQSAVADSHVAQLKRRLASRAEEKTTA